MFRLLIRSLLSLFLLSIYQHNGNCLVQSSNQEETEVVNHYNLDIVGLQFWQRQIEKNCLRLLQAIAV